MQLLLQRQPIPIVRREDSNMTMDVGGSPEGRAPTGGSGPTNPTTSAGNGEAGQNAKTEALQQVGAIRKLAEEAQNLEERAAVESLAAQKAADAAEIDEIIADVAAAKNRYSGTTATDLLALSGAHRPAPPLTENAAIDEPSSLTPLPIQKSSQQLTVEPLAVVGGEVGKNSLVSSEDSGQNEEPLSAEETAPAPGGPEAQPAAPDQPATESPSSGAPGADPESQPGATPPAAPQVDTPEYQKIINAIQEKHKGVSLESMKSEEQRQALGTDYEAYRDAKLDERAEGIRNGNGTAEEKADGLKKVENDRIAAAAQDVLAKDSKYQKALDDVQKLNKNSKEYREAQLTKQLKELNAQTNARQERARKGYDDQGNPITTQEAKDKRVHELEANRRQKHVDLILAANPKYEKLRPVLDGENGARTGIRQDIQVARAARKDNTPITLEEVNAELDRVLKKTWKELTDNERELFGNINVFRDAQVVRSMETAALHDATTDRISQGYDENGQDIKDNPEATRNAMEKANKSWDPGPGALRRRFYGISKFIDDVFGNRVTNDKFKEATGTGRRLIATYGWRGLFPNLFMLGDENKAKREQALILRGKALKALYSYGWRTLGPKLAFKFLIAFAVFWIAQPLIIGKVLEVSKPFGGGS